jgi:hypothetical protein
MLHYALPKWFHKCLRINVRGLIVLVLIIGAGLSWIVHGARIQREAVVAIRRDGGFVSYDWERKGHSRWDGQFWQSDGKPEAPEWLVHLLGADYFGHAVSVALGQRGSPSTLSNIGRLNHVDRLDFHGPFVTDAGLAHLKGLTKLNYLNFGYRGYDCTGGTSTWAPARVTDAGMPYLKGLAILSFLDLSGTQVSDVGLENLAGLTELLSLRLSDTRVSDAGLAHLEGMTKLSDLDLSGTAVSDEGLAHLKALTNLAFLRIRGTQITDAGLAHLKGLTELRMLDLSDTRITDAGLAHLKGLTKLFDIDLRGTQVSGGGERDEVDCLAGIPQLRSAP